MGQLFQKGHTLNNGRVLTTEHKDKIREGMLSSDKPIGRKKGCIPWNKGMKRSNGDPIPTYTYPELSEESKKHKSEARLGKHYSSRTEFKKGLAPWNKGKECSVETKEKISKANKNPTDETREKMSKAKKGKHLTPEHIRKVLTRRTPTSLEMKFLSIVEKNNLPYKFVGDGSFMIERKNPDFVNTDGKKIVVEVYARFFKLKHAATVNEWKEERLKFFNEQGWEVMFFDETQVEEETVVRQLMAA